MLLEIVFLDLPFFNGMMSLFHAILTGVMLAHFAFLRVPVIAAFIIWCVATPMYRCDQRIFAARQATQLNKFH